MLLISSLCYSVSLWILVMAVPQVFAMMFNTNEELVSYTVPALRMYLGALLLFGIQVACQMTFTSMGNAVASVVVAVVRKFVLLLPLIYTADKATAVFMAEPLADTVAVLFTAILFFSNSADFCGRWTFPIYLWAKPKRCLLCREELLPWTKTKKILRTMRRTSARGGGSDQLANRWKKVKDHYAYSQNIFSFY